MKQLGEDYIVGEVLLSNNYILQVRRWRGSITHHLTSTGSEIPHSVANLQLKQRLPTLDIGQTNEDLMRHVVNACDTGVFEVQGYALSKVACDVDNTTNSPVVATNHEKDKTGVRNIPEPVKSRNVQPEEKLQISLELTNENLLRLAATCDEKIAYYKHKADSNPDHPTFAAVKRREETNWRHIAHQIKLALKRKQHKIS